MSDVWPDLTCPACGHDHLAIGSFCDACGAEMNPSTCVGCDPEQRGHNLGCPAGVEALSTRHPLSARFHEILAELGALHDRKQADYGRATDPFANVRASTDWGMPAWVGAMVRATDKLRRLQKVAQGGTLENEGVIDSLNDLAVYAIIARVLYEEETHWRLDVHRNAQHGGEFFSPAVGAAPKRQTPPLRWIGDGGVEEKQT